MTKNMKSIIFLLLIILFMSFPVISKTGISGVEKGVRVAQNSIRPNFNHDSTSFQLLGAHRGLECNKCHFGGKYKGTPRTCESCHNGQLTYGKPEGHLVTAQTCTLCHSVNAWVPSHFVHDSSVAGKCSNCHNGQKATGKPSNHINTASQCDTCHKTTAWVPAGFNHANLAGQLCSSCHKPGGAGIGPKNDLVHTNLTGQDCKSCHSSTTTFTTVTMNHTGIVASCSTCHYVGNSVGAVAKPANHMATTQECNLCHSGTTTFANGVFDHSTLAGQTCNSCHKAGGIGMAPKNDVVHANLAGQDCKSCHSSTTTFTTVTMNHIGIVASCSTCHYVGNSVGAVAKPANHVVTTSECNLCHAGTTTFANGIFNHSGLTGQLCSSCHKSGGAGLAPKNDVVHNNLNGTDCSSCHASTTTFTTWTMNHSGISPPAACATCHIAGNTVGAVSVPNPHPYAAANSDCSQCHKSFTSFAGAMFNHTGVTSCKTCHFAGNTTGAMPPPATAGDLIHNPLSNIVTDCNSCHTTTQSGGFSSYNMVHTAILNYSTTCQNCHKAGNPMGAVYKPNHNVGVICGNCHSTNTFDK